MKRRILSVVICLILIFSVVVPINSIGTDLKNETSENKITPYTEALPEFVTREMLKLNNGVTRLKDEEPDLNSVIYRNLDGSKTLYMFSENVKYIDENGVVKDKSNKVTAVKDIQGYSYSNVHNDISVLFPKTFTIDKGVLVEKDDINIEMYPRVELTELELISVPTVTLKNDKTVLYDDVFGTDTALTYSPTFSGVKEEIILYDRPNANSFSFLLDVGDLNPIKIGGQVWLYEGKEKVAYISEVMVYDSSDISRKTFDNEVSLAYTGNSGEYIYTITVDESFLNNDTTVYPVYVDPTITVNTSGTGDSKTILDAPVYNGIPNLNQGSNYFNHIGYVGTSGGINYGVGRLLVKLPGLYNNATFASVAPQEITNVSVVFTELSGKSATSTLQLSEYAYPGHQDGNGNWDWWQEGTITYNGVTWNMLNDMNYPSLTVSDSSTKLCTYDITGLARKWKREQANPHNGFVIRNTTSETDANYCKTFASTEYGSNKPYVSFTYTQATFNSSLNVYNRYDNGYLVRYGLTDSAATSRINQYIANVASRYSALLGLTLTNCGTSYYYSLPDWCKGTVTSANIDDLCNCNTDFPCTNRDELHSDFKIHMASIISNNVKNQAVLWCAHKIATGTNEYNRSAFYPDYHTYMLHVTDTITQVVIMHELNHSIGADDHYHAPIEGVGCLNEDRCIECKGKYARDPNCIMNETYRQSINDSDIICYHCKSNILDHLIQNGFTDN